MRTAQGGSALFMILMAVALFAALAFTFSRGLQQGSQSLSDRQAELATSDILAYAARAERVVSRMLQGQQSERDISFEGLEGTYTNTNCTVDDCKIFAPEGAALAPTYPMPDWLDSSHSTELFYKTWFVTARFCVPQIGDDTCLGSTGTDLVMLLPYIRKTLCEKINDKLGIPTPVPSPSSVGSIDAGGKFNGAFNPTGPTLWDDAVLNGKFSGCIQDGASTYHFYQVLIPR